MGFQDHPGAIVWRMHTTSSPERVYAMLDSSDGRAAFWAESAVERDGTIIFEFVNGIRYESRILERDPPGRWRIEYFGSTVTFTLDSDGAGGTDVTVTDEGVADEHRAEVTAGWLNVLFPLKGAVDHGIDLRSHDPTRTWQQGYIDQ